MTDESTPRSRTLSRRRLLRTTAGAGCVTALGGIAGCTGGDGGDGGGDTGDGGDGGSGGGGGGGPFSCTDLTSGYETYDSGEIAFVFDVDLPETVIDNAEYDSGFNELDANRATASGEKLTGVTVKMNVIGGEPNFDPVADVEQTGTLSFNGEDRPVYAISGATDVSRTVELPYEIDGETNYFKTSVIVGNEFSEMTEECEPTFDEVAQTVMMSLAVNEDTTIESEAET